MIADKHKFICKAQRTETHRQSNLRSLINNAVVEFPSREQDTVWQSQLDQPSLTKKNIEKGTHWSIERQVVATTGGVISCCSSCSTVVGALRLLSVNRLTSGCTYT